VDRDDGAETAALVGAEDDLLVAVEVVEDGRRQLLGHGGALSVSRPAEGGAEPDVKSGWGGAGAGLVYETPITEEVLEIGHIPFTTKEPECHDRAPVGGAGRA
jgi:hypothetical protein